MAIVIAGTHSGAGKTTVSSAIMRLLVRHGGSVAAFKSGPDYIDPKFHAFITGRPSANLDAWMLDEDAVRYIFEKHAGNADYAVIEGAMGLFDGCGSGSEGSASHVARIINAPVVLVVNAQGMGGSAAAMVSGYRDFDNRVAVRGVIFNNVSGPRHYEILAASIRGSGVECLGWLPKLADCALESRHLGLVPVEEVAGLSKTIDRIADAAEQYLDMERLSALASRRCADGKERVCGTVNEQQVFLQRLHDITARRPGEGLRIAVAQDEAFSFYYRDNLDLMRDAGIDVVPFSPMRDNRLPGRVDALYLGGGFPEVFASVLSHNTSMIENLRGRLEDGLPAYAECGGLLYLTGGIAGEDCGLNRLVNFFNCSARMTGRLNRFGYVTVSWGGVTTRGHEFHHSVLDENDDADYERVFTVTRAADQASWECGLIKKNVLAGYPHIHFYSNLEFFEKIISLFLKGKS